MDLTGDEEEEKKEEKQEKKPEQQKSQLIRQGSLAFKILSLAHLIPFHWFCSMHIIHEYNLFALFSVWPRFHDYNSMLI